MNKMYIFIAILFSLFFVGCFLWPLGKKINGKVSSSYYYNHLRTKIIYCSNGVWVSGSAKRIIESADVSSFEPIAEDLAKDKNIIYYKNSPQPHVDLSSFVFSENVMKDKNHVYYADNSDFLNPTLKIIPHAIAESYEINTNYSEWAKDKHNIFLDGNLITNVDYLSFNIVNKNFSYDKNNLYTKPSLLFENYDRESIELKILDNKDANITSITNMYAYSNNKLYGVSTNLFAQINYIDKTISNVKEIDSATVIINNEEVFYNGSLFPHKVDAPTFKKVDDWYFKDKNHVFYRDSLMQDMDALTFEVIKDPNYKLDSHYYRDKNNVYYIDTKVPVKNPLNFQYDKAKRSWTEGYNSFNGSKIWKKN